ncbi:hypothetical protein D3C71_33940 [compost metagenome]
MKRDRKIYNLAFKTKAFLFHINSKLIWLAMVLVFVPVLKETRIIVGKLTNKIIIFTQLNNHKL